MGFPLIPLVIWGGRALWVGARVLGPRLLTGLGHAGRWAVTTKGKLFLGGAAAALEGVPSMIQEHERLGFERITEWKWGTILSEAGLAAGAYIVLLYGGAIGAPLLVGVQLGRGEVRHRLGLGDRQDTYFGALVQVPPMLLGTTFIKAGGKLLFGPPKLGARQMARAMSKGPAQLPDTNWMQTPTGIVLNAGRSVSQELFVRETCGISPTGGGEPADNIFGDICGATTDAAAGAIGVVWDKVDDLLEAGGSFPDTRIVAPNQPAPRDNLTLRLEKELLAQGFPPGGVDGVRDEYTVSALNQLIMKQRRGVRGYHIDPTRMGIWQPATHRFYNEWLLDIPPNELGPNEVQIQKRAENNIRRIRMMSERHG